MAAFLMCHLGGGAVGTPGAMSVRWFDVWVWSSENLGLKIHLALADDTSL